MTTTMRDADPAAGCPKCGGALWDNRATKKNPKAPDYRCKDRDCDGAIWPPKGGNGNGNGRSAAPSTKQGYSIGGPLPGEPEYGDVPAQRAAVAAIVTPPVDPAVRLKALFDLHGKCLAHVVKVYGPYLEEAKIGASPESVAAMTATLFIAAKERGIP